MMPARLMSSKRMEIFGDANELGWFKRFEWRSRNADRDVNEDLDRFV